MERAHAVCTGPSGTISVGPTGTYSTLTAAIAATSSGISASVIFELQSTYTSTGETFPITFSANICVDATHTITIRPASGASALSITSSNTTATLDFNGGTYITIDGRPGGTGTTSQLTIANTSASSAVTTRFINDASNNTINYCTLSGSTTSTGVVAFSTGVTTGNDNNTISNNNIGPAGTNPPLNCIYSLGTSTAIDNSGNTISSNNISDYFDPANPTNGINLNSNNSTWTITNNRIFQTATRIYTTANTHTGINIASGAGYLITGNIIGYASATATGTTNLVGNSAALSGTFPGAYTVSGTANATRYTAINCAFTAGGTVSSIQNNTIAGFALYTSNSVATTTGMFCGIAVASGAVNIGTVTGNTIGSTAGTGSIYAATTTTGGIIAGIYVSSANAVAIRNNTIGALDAMGTTSSVSGGINGINTAGPSSSYDVSGNIIGNPTNPSLRMGNLNDASANLSNVGTVFGVASGIAQFNGILSSQTGAGTIGTPALPNIIRNTSLNSSGASTSIRGITASGVPIISSNLINNLTSQSTNIAVGSTLLAGMGIFLNSITTLGAVVTKNTINSLSLTNTTTSGTNITGIAVYASTSEISYNKIYDIDNASTSTTVATPGTANGIFLRQPGGVHTIFNNMISLGNAQTTNTAFNGIWMQNSVVAYTLNCYFNTINIEGTATSGSAQPSFCFNRGSYSATTVVIPVDIRNNVFVNSRSGGSGKHYAIGNCYGATAVNTGWGTNASNYNVLNAATANVGYWTADVTFSAWQAAAVSDANSMSGVSVAFAGTLTGDLHASFGTTATRLESGGTPISGFTTDYDNQVRPGPAGSVNGGACAPDLGADEFDGVPLDLSGPAITYTALTGTSCLIPATRVLSPVAMADCSGINITTGTKPRVYYKKSGDANTYAGNTSGDNGWKYVEASNASSPFTFTIDYSILQSAVVTADVIQYFVVAQDLATTPNVGIGSGVFTAIPASVALTSAAFPVTGTINSYNIIAPGLSGTLTIGATGAYTSLTGATGLFNAINTFGLTGNVTASIIDPTVTENGSIALNNMVTTGCASGTFTVVIKPQPSVAATLTGTNATALIKLNGADNVTIDGVNAGGSSLKIINTSTAGTTIWIGSASATDPATNITIRNCTIAGGLSSGSVAGIVAGSGITFGAAAEASNSGNTIQGNVFTAAQNGIYISGQIASLDQNWLIDGNTFGSATVAADKLGYRGLSLQGVNNFTISNNTINGVVTATTATATGITTFITATNGNIFNNKVSDIKNTNTGGFGCNGIALSGTSTTSNINLYNNFVSDVASYGFNGYAVGDNGYGIVLVSGGGYNLYHNTVLMNTDQISTTGNPTALNITSGLTTSGSLNIRDNIFATTQLIGNRYAVISTAISSIFTDINYNNYYSGSSSNLGYFNGNITTLAAWRTASGKDALSLNVAPVFVSATPIADLHLSNAAGANWCLNGAGTAITGFNTDIDAQTWATPPDIGADEFTPTSNTIATPAAQVSCSGSAMTTIVLSGAAASYTWTRDNTATVTGIAASGNGNISGTLTNTTTAPITVSFTITSVNAAGCTFGATTTASVIVNPTPNAASTPSSQTICSGLAITTISHTGTIPGTVFNWLRDNTATVTGITASGAGNISGSLTNTTTSPITVTFTITPAYTNASTTCNGTPVTATVLVNPANTVSLTSATGTNAQTVCINNAIANITYATTGATGATITGLPAGVSGSWAANVVTINGTPTASGTFPYTVTLTGGCGGAVTATGTINVTPNNTVTLSSTAGTTAQTVCINTGIANITYATTSATGATFSGLPAGVSGSWAANVVTISGSPSVSGSFSYVVTLTGGCGTITAAGSITVTPDNTILLSSAAATTTQSRCVNTAITNITYASTGATGVTVTGLPAGVSGVFAANVVTISGTPTALGVFNYTVTLTGGCGTATATGTITVVNANAVTLSSAAGTNAQTLCISNPITNITYSTAGATGASFAGLPAGVSGSWAANVVTITGSPSVAGTFSYTVTLTGGCGGVVTATGSINVTSNNTATLSSAVGTNAQTKCINTAITNITYTTSGATGATFTGLPTGVTGSWAASVVTITGTPSVAGTFSYIVTLTGGCGTSTVTGTITVSPNNTITLSSAAGTNAQVRCINTAITNITYATTGATGATITGLPTGITGSLTGSVFTITGTPSVSGTFNYTITLNGGCAAGTAVGTITVSPNNTINLTSTTGTNAQIRCLNVAITNITYGTTGASGATVTGLPAGVTGTWAGNVVTITGSPSASGSFTYLVTLTGGCGTVTATGTILVNPLPPVSISPTTPAVICAGSSTTLTASGASTYLWFPSAGLSSATTASVIASPAGSTNYNVTGTDGNGCVNTVSKFVTVNALPNITITPATAVSFCQGLNVILNAFGAATYIWSPATGLSATTGSSVLASPPSTTTYTITGTGTNGCVNTATKTVTIIPAPDPTITPGGYINICQDDTVYFTAVPGYSNYVWKLYGVPIKAGVASNFPTFTGGFYTLTVTDANGCTSTTPAPTVITVTQHPLPKIKRVGITLDAGAGFATYQWYVGGVIIGGATNRIYTPSAGGAYTVAVTDTTGLHCPGTSEIFNYIGVGVAGNPVADEIRLYPNPTNDLLHIDAPIPVSVSVSSMDGKQLLFSNNAHEINIGVFADGIYRVVIRDRNGDYLKMEKITKISR